MKTNLKVGDKVRVFGDISWRNFKGEIGVIAKIDGDGTSYRDIGVDFGGNFEGHTLGNAIKSPTGFWVSQSNCTVIEEKPKHKFKVGDKVKIRQWDDMVMEFGLGSFGHINCKYGFTNGMKPLCGEIATISEIYGEGCDKVRLNFNTKSKDTVWSYSIDMIEPCDEEKIVIYRIGNKVVAKDIITGKECYSRCHPDDEFDFNIGAKLAFDRLVGNVETEPKPKYYNGKVVCVDNSWNTLSYTVGKIYEFVDGFAIDDDGDRRPMNGVPVKSLNEYHSMVASKFIEVIE